MEEKVKKISVPSLTQRRGEGGDEDLGVFLAYLKFSGRPLWRAFCIGVYISGYESAEQNREQGDSRADGGGRGN